MATESAAPTEEQRLPFSQRVLNGIENVGNKVPHPVLMFLYLIIFVIVLSTALDLAGVQATETVAVAVPYPVTANYYEDTTQDQTVVPIEHLGYGDTDFELRQETIAVRGLVSISGIRFIFTSFVPNFANFGVIAVTFIAMLGAGAAEGAGLMGALIRKLVVAAPAGLITFLIILVGAISSIASDAGYLILIPLAAVAFLTVGRHPLAGMAAAFAGVGAIFAVNIIPKPLDAMITEIANESIGSSGNQLSVVSNIYFNIVSTILMCIVATVVSERIIEPRLGKFVPDPDSPLAAGGGTDVDAASEARGLRWALYGFLGVLAVVILATAPPGAPLREPGTGAIIGNTPFMDSLLFIIALFFLVAGVGYGYGAGTFTSSNDVINAITKTFSGLAGLIFMLLMIAQFIAYFNFSNLPRVVAITFADLLERANVSSLPLLIGFIIVILILDVIIPGVIPKWAIFAPVFIPIFTRLGVAPQTVLAAYRVGDSPLNVFTPLMVYFPFIVTIAQRYRKDAGIGTIISLMVPYVVILSISWIALFVLWFLIGIPVGPGYPVGN